MQIHKLWWVFLALFYLAVNISAVPALAAEKKAAASKAKTYTEEEFIRLASGKTRRVITELIGAPSKKEQSIKPAGAGTMMARMGTKGGKEETANVEMWYYTDMVRYDKKNTYKRTELTFVNDRCMNITFLNPK